MRQIPALERRVRIVQKQCARFLFPKLNCHHVISRLQPQWPRPVIVRIAGHEMNYALADPLQPNLLRRRPETARERRCGQLGKAAAPHPFSEPLRMPSQNCVPLRVRDDQAQSRKLQLVQGSIHRRRDGDFIEFQKQVIVLIDAVLR